MDVEVVVIVHVGHINGRRRTVPAIERRKR